MSKTSDALRFAYRGPHTIGQVAWSPSGRLLATGNAAGQLWVWDSTTGQERVCTQLHETWVSVSALSWSPEGNQLLSSGIDGRIAIYDLQQGETQTLYQYPPGYDSAEVAGTNQAKARWSPDGRYIVSGGWEPDDIVIHVWEPSTRRLIQRWIYSCGDSSHVSSFQWSPDSRWLASGDELGAVHLWDPFRGERRACYEAPRMKEGFYLHYIQAIAWSPDGKYLACGDDFGCVQVWDTRAQRRVAIYSPDAAVVEEEAKQTGRSPFPIRTRGLAWLPDGMLASAHRSVQIHNPMTGAYLTTTIETLEIETPSLPSQVAWSPDWTTLASVGNYVIRVNEGTMEEGAIYEGFLHLWRWQPTEK